MKEPTRGVAHGMSSQTPEKKKRCEVTNRGEKGPKKKKNLGYNHIIKRIAQAGWDK